MLRTRTPYPLFSLELRTTSLLSVIFAVTLLLLPSAERERNC